MRVRDILHTKGHDVVTTSIPVVDGDELETETRVLRDYVIGGR